jgi:hypothetical protein
MRKEPHFAPFRTSGEGLGGPLNAMPPPLATGRI